MRGADDYAAGVLAGLEADVTRTLRSIERGISMLDERRAAQTPQLQVEDTYEADIPLELPPLVEDEEEASAVGRR